ncbi:MAG: alpha/beta fold hydrolase [Burkholderiaceae bacterium]
MTYPLDTSSQHLEIRKVNWPTDQVVRRAIIFLHEGLGSAAAWQAFPEKLCIGCGLPGLVYSRAGYGQSAGLTKPFAPDFLHIGASIELDQLLIEQGIEQAILVGHSDGASIAIIYAGQPHQMSAQVTALVAIAPHLFVEPICVQAIERLSQKVREAPERLALLRTQHRDIDALFAAWTTAWLSPDFHDLNLRVEATNIACPVLAVQGEHDQYGTLEQVRSLTALAPHGQLLVMPDCRHSPHVEATAPLLKACENFIQAAVGRA